MGVILNGKLWAGIDLIFTCQKPGTVPVFVTVILVGSGILN